MGTQSVGEYCRRIETYLCQKNDGHLIRVVGPSFDLVSGWAARGVPLKVAFEGIDRYFQRYYRNGPRRRPVKIDFCEADVLDVFDEWRKAVLVSSRESGVRSHESGVESAVASGVGTQASVFRRQPSLPAHLERVVTRLTSARACGALGGEFDSLIDHIARELEVSRGVAGGVRGEARRSLVQRLASLDAELMNQARAGLDPTTMAALSRAADVELAPFRAGMTPDAWSRAKQAAMERLVRDHFRLPTIAFT